MLSPGRSHRSAVRSRSVPITFSPASSSISAKARIPAPKAPTSNQGLLRLGEGVPIDGLFSSFNIAFFTEPSWQSSGVTFRTHHVNMLEQYCFCSIFDRATRREKDRSGRAGPHLGNQLIANSSFLKFWSADAFSGSLVSWQEWFSLRPTSGRIPVRMRRDFSPRTGSSSEATDDVVLFRRT